MKIKPILLCIIFASTGVNAAKCLTTAEQKVVNKNYKNSLDSYDYVKVDCNNTKLKIVCSDLMNVKMLNTMIRMNVWDEENALKTEYTAQDLSKLQQRYANDYSKKKKKKIKRDFFEAISWNGGWNY